MDVIRPVVKGMEQYEIILGGKEAGQPEVTEVAALRSIDGRVVTRWAFTEEERQAIARGEDLYLTSHTFNNPYQMVKIDIGLPCSPSKLKREMRLEEHLELMTLLKDSNDLNTAVQQRQLELLKADEKVNELGKKAEQARAKLERKKAEVFSGKKESNLVLVN